jgi:hypothetical protein
MPVSQERKDTVSRIEEDEYLILMHKQTLNTACVLLAKKITDLGSSYGSNAPRLLKKVLRRRFLWVKR